MKLSFSILILFIEILVSCSTKAVKESSNSANLDLKCYFFFIPGCPASENNLLKLIELEKKYNENVEFISVLSEPDFDLTTLDSIKKNLNLNFKLIVDDSLLIAKKHGATVTPECFLYDFDDNLLYRGAFDDYYTNVGKHNLKVNYPFLENAIKSSIQKQSIKVSKTKAIGCKINLDYFE